MKRKKNAHIEAYWLCPRIYPNTPPSKYSKMGLCSICVEPIYYHPFVTSDNSKVAKKICPECLVTKIPPDVSRKMFSQLAQNMLKLAGSKPKKES